MPRRARSGSGESQSRDELGAARAARRPASEPARGADSEPEGRRPEALGARRSGSASAMSATCSGTCRTATATARTCSRSASCGSGEEATILAEVRSARVRPTRRRNLRIVEATVADRSGATKAVWFNQAWLAERLRPGTRLLLSGKARPLGIPGLRPRADPRRHARRPGPAHRRARPGPLGHRRPQRRPGPRMGLAGARPSRATPSRRCRPSFGPAGGLAGRRRRAVRDPLPGRRRGGDAARERLAFEELFLHQVALAVPAPRPRAHPARRSPSTRRRI